MPDRLPDWLGDIHQVLPHHWAGVICTIAACLCGAAIGFERQHARKPTGMRTVILICLGSAIFTQASILIASTYGGDHTRIAAQIVTGIGFLGAGAIIHERGLLIGVTTGAGIWATAAVGVILGAGYVAAGVFFSTLIVTVLACSTTFDRMVLGKCHNAILRITFDPKDGRTQLKIQSILDAFPHQLKSITTIDHDGRHTMAIEYCAAHREHRAFIGDVVDLPGIISVATEPAADRP